MQNPLRPSERSGARPDHAQAAQLVLLADGDVPEPDVGGHQLMDVPPLVELRINPSRLRRKTPSWLCFAMVLRTPSTVPAPYTAPWTAR